MNQPALLIPRLKIQNANAFSSPFTIGFPAMTAWLGFMHALQRKLQHENFNPVLGGISIVSHEFNLQVHKGVGDYEYSVIGTANPLDKDGSRPAFIEEPRCHLEVSLAIQYEGVSKLQEQEFITTVKNVLNSGIKCASGDILAFEQLVIHRNLAQLKRHLMPGYVLIERRDLMCHAMENSQDAIEAIIDYVAIHHQSVKDQDGNIAWQSKRKALDNDMRSGWIVPISVGFQGLSDLGQAKNQRDTMVEHRFAESIVTLGEFKMAYRIETAEQLFWHYHYQEDNSLYLCQQQNLSIQADGYSEFDEDEF
ncbi:MULTISPECIES: type I-F CRISPR-associated protein Csy2 [Cysteiniphilum]|uniref:type I-F CRISPR-associated protein Csy2 n=1 Tax=Cysteiniphilum TaxID=2056696 RepID=UPI001782DE38|nr:MULTISPECIES: type I-F CRISPR-associated protein Csy2 [Cysteiniphilum]